MLLVRIRSALISRQRHFCRLIIPSLMFCRHALNPKGMAAEDQGRDGITNIWIQAIWLQDGPFLPLCR